MTDEEVEKIIKQNMSLTINLAGIRADFEAAQQRTWIGLTNEEVKDALRKVMHSDTNGVVRAIEAKLKAKNFA
jgi:hypothetical protein